MNNELSVPTKSTDALYRPRAPSAQAYQHQNLRFRITNEYRDVWAILLYVFQFVIFLGLSGYAYYNIATKGFGVQTLDSKKNATLARDYDTHVQPLIKYAALYFAAAFVVMGLLCIIFVQYMKS